MDETSRSAQARAIRTPDQRLRVFVSSSLAEVEPERAVTRAAIEQMHLTPVLFELGARPHPPRALYSAYLAQSDVFIGIYWQRYGWVAAGATVSGLEDEYELSSKLPRLLYVKEPAPDREALLSSLVARFEREASSSYRKFMQPDELGRLVADDLAVLLSERFGASRGGGPPDTPTAALPVLLTPTFGRQKEVAAVARVLRRGARLVTLTGTAGVGKSRLAVVVARKLMAEHRGDVFFIRLSALNDPSHLIATIAEQIGVRSETSDPRDALPDRLRDRPTMLVLDNFEHLTSAASDVLSLLDRCEQLQVLVTSRQVLRVRGEHEIPLAPLDVPSRDVARIRRTSAVKLFVDRAAAARPGFVLTPGNQQVIAEVCRRLDGLPLALELAAARIRVLEPDEILDRLAAHLDLLAGGASDLPEHQRALRTTLDWSYNLLTPTEQVLLARLSVFSGGATLAAVGDVCPDDESTDVLEGMASLLEKSLLIHVVPTSGRARFEMLQVVRAYASERLASRGEIDLLRARHARWFLRAIRPWEIGAVSDVRWDFLDVEIDNARAVITWALEKSDLSAVASLARDLRSPWWRMKGMAWEALDWLQRAATMADRISPTSVEKAWISLALGHILDQAGRSEESEAPARSALELFASHRVSEGIFAARLTLAVIVANRGRTDEAIALARETLDQGREAGRDGVVEVAASILGTCCIAAGDLDAARSAHQLARETAARMGAELYLAMAHHQLAVVELMAGQLKECWAHLREVAAVYSRMSHTEGISYSLEIAAAACVAECDIEQAAEAMALAQQMHDNVQLPMWPVVRPWHDQLIAELLAAISGVEPRLRPASATAAALLQRICEFHMGNRAQPFVRGQASEVEIGR